MVDIFGMMKQAQQLQSKMQEMQDQLSNVEVEGISGGGLVAVRMTAKMDVKGIKIDPSLMKPEEREVCSRTCSSPPSAMPAARPRRPCRRRCRRSRAGSACRRVCSANKMGSVAGPEIERLVQLLARLPGLGPRSARRAALHLIKKREALMMPLSSALQVALDKVQVCKTCGNIDTQNPCTVCTDPKRDDAIIVVVADVADLWALERANATQGRYHVLGATLSPLDGVGPQDLTIDALVARAHAAEVHEIILALNATVDGQTTAHYITDLLQDANVKVTRLAHGVPVGGELDYLDEGTLSAAMRQRTLF
ncbi:recombination protein RecR/DNA-binding YbaB/EbfC family protein [Bradyrhizobium sp. i1.3.6]